MQSEFEAELMPLHDEEDLVEQQHRQSSRASLWQRFASFLKRSKQESNNNTTLPILFASAAAAPSPQQQPPVVVRTKGWSCGALAFIVALVVVILIVMVVVVFSMNGLWSRAERVGNSVASLFTRYAALQQHHTLAAYFDSYGDTVLSEDVRTETIGGPKSFSRIAGSVDFATMRLDWDVQVIDAHNALGGPTMTLALWVQEYDQKNATHLLKHVTHSPLVLCRNVSVTSACTGSLDHPALDTTIGLERDPRVRTIAIYRANGADLTAPVWIVPVE